MSAASLGPLPETDCPSCHGDGMLAVPSLEVVEHLKVCSCLANLHQLGAAAGTRFGGNAHPMTYLRSCGRVAMVDVGVAEDVARLWEIGVWTWVSCQGGSSMSRYVGLTDARDLFVAMRVLGWVRDVVASRTDVFLYDRPQHHRRLPTIGGDS